MITSDQVSALISAQAQQRASALAMVAQASNPTGYEAQMRQQQALSISGQPESAVGGTLASAGGYIAQGAINLPGAAFGVVGVGAFVGMAPAWMEPMTAAVRYGRAAAAGGSAVGAGLAGGLAVGAGIMGGYMAAGAAAQHLVFNPMRTGAEMMSQSMAFASSMFPQQSLSSLMPVATSVLDFAKAGVGSVPELQMLAMQGIMAGSLNTRSMSEFNTGFANAVGSASSMARLMNVSLMEGAAAHQALIGLGVKNTIGTASSIMGYAHATGSTNAEMFQAAAAGAAAAKMAGVDRELGVNASLSNLSRFKFAARKGIAGITEEDAGVFTNAGYRFLGSAQGSEVLAAMMDDQGNLDTTMAQRVASGAITKSEIRSRARKVMADSSMMDMFSSRSTELAAGFMFEFGPEGIARPLDIMTRGKHAETMKAQLTELNRAQLGQLSTLSSLHDSLAIQLQNAAQEGFGTNDKAGVLEKISRSIDRAFKPTKDYFREVGETISKRILRNVEEMTEPYTGRTMRADPMLLTRLRTAQLTGDVATVSNINAVVSAAGPIGADSMVTNAPMRDYLPRLFQAEREDVDPLSMPAFGLLPTDHLGLTGHAALAGTAITGHYAGKGFAFLDNSLKLNRAMGKSREAMKLSASMLDTMFTSATTPSQLAAMDELVVARATAQTTLNAARGLGTTERIAQTNEALVGVRKAMAAAKGESYLFSSIKNMASGVRTSYGSARMALGAARGVSAAGKYGGIAGLVVTGALDSALAMHEHAVEAGWAEPLGALVDTQKEQVEMLKDAGFLNEGDFFTAKSEYKEGAASTAANVIRWGGFMSRGIESGVKSAWDYDWKAGLAAGALAATPYVFTKAPDVISRTVASLVDIAADKHEGLAIAGTYKDGVRTYLRNEETWRKAGAELAKRVPSYLAAAGNAAVTRSPEQHRALQEILAGEGSNAEKRKKIEELVGNEDVAMGIALGEGLIMGMDMSMSGVDKKVQEMFKDKAELLSAYNDGSMKALAREATVAGVIESGGAFREFLQSKGIKDNRLLNQASSAEGRSGLGLFVGREFNQAGYEEGVRFANNNREYLRDAVTTVQKAGGMAGVNVSKIEAMLGEPGVQTNAGTAQTRAGEVALQVATGGISAERLSALAGLLSGSKHSTTAAVGQMLGQYAGVREAWETSGKGNKNMRRVLEATLGDLTHDKELDKFFSDKRGLENVYARRAVETRVAELLRDRDLGKEDMPTAVSRIAGQLLDSAYKRDEKGFYTAVHNITSAPMKTSAKPVPRNGELDEKMAGFVKAIGEATTELGKIKAPEGKGWFG